ncbi:MAG: hypothetical protein JKY70_05700 [Mucilaginibacter sp.]|nr:hypothetical protein [Mucilaginibacter sp.]
MFYNELNALDKLGNALSGVHACKTSMPEEPQTTIYPAIVKHSSEARESWAFAVFNAGDDAAVRRFISYEMMLLYKYEKTCSSGNIDSGIKKMLADLSRYLYDHYAHFLLSDTKLPLSLVESVISALMCRIDLVQKIFGSQIKDEPLKSLILNQFREIRNLQYTGDPKAGELVYAERFVHALEQTVRNEAKSSTTETVIEKLVEFNFNNIQFFLYLEDITRQLLVGQTINDQLAELRRQKRKYDYLKPEDAYSHKWKPIGEMMATWITEEIVRISAAAQSEASTPVSATETLGFNLSVAQLACLTKVFFKADIYLSNITWVLNWSARYFHSKQQPHISEISFSKHYYSVSQRTASQILNLLQKMCSIIKKDYFPLLAVISAVHLLI